MKIDAHGVHMTRAEVEREIRWWRRHLLIGWLVFAIAVAVSAGLLASGWRMAEGRRFVAGPLCLVLGLLNGRAAQLFLNRDLPRVQKAIAFWEGKLRNPENPLDT